MNRLYFGDNLQWLRDAKGFPGASVDLVYLDPPFNSNADYNYASPARPLFPEASGAASQAKIQIVAIDGLLDGAETINAPPQLNPFATAARETNEHQQTEML